MITFALHISVILFFTGIILGFLCPAGLFLAEKCRIPDELNPIASILFGVIYWSILISIFLFLGLENSLIEKLLLGIVSLHGVLFLKKKKYLELKSFGWIPFLVIFAISISISSLNKGNLLKVTVFSVLEATGLPVDNTISYNFSRLLIEKKDIRKEEVVPTWNATERGPIGGLITTAQLLVSGMLRVEKEENTQDYSYLLYHFLLTFLNCSSILCLWCVFSKEIGKRATFWAIAALGTNHFYLLNTFFTWPKFFAASFGLLALSLMLRKRYILSGLLMGFAHLTHQSLLFFILLAIAFLLLFGPERRKVVFVVLAFLITISPWQIYKSSGEKFPSRIQELSLFCNYDLDISKTTPKTSLKKYIETHGVKGILEIRKSNLIMPFNFSALLDLKLDNFFPHYSILSFFHLSYCLGFIYFPLMLVSVIGARRKSAEWRDQISNAGFLLAFLSLLPAVVVLGCPKYTVNHVWAYPIILLSFPFITNTIFNNLDKKKFYSRILLILFIVGVFINIYFSYELFSLRLGFGRRVPILIISLILVAYISYRKSLKWDLKSL